MEPPFFRDSLLKSVYWTTCLLLTYENKTEIIKSKVIDVSTDFSRSLKLKTYSDPSTKSRGNVHHMT